MLETALVAWLEIAIILFKAVLLVATIMLLIYSIKEGKQRDKLIIEVGKATRVLTRKEYFFTIIDSMMDAKEEVIGCITGRPPIGEDDKQMTKGIIENIKRMTKKGVRVRYLMPKFPDRLHLGYLYMKAGAEIIYSSCLMVHNIRFMIVDSKIVVMGVPESTGEKEATKKGYQIPSEGLAMVLRDYFENCERQTGFTEYFKEVSNQTSATPEHIAREYQIDVDEIKRLVK